MRTAEINGALDQYRKSLKIDRELAAADPTNDQALLDLSFSEGKVGSALGKLGRTGAALAILHTGMKRQETLANKDPNDGVMYGHLANSYTRLGACLLESGDTKMAVEYYRKAVAARLRLSEMNLGISAFRGALAESYANLGNAVASINVGEALEYYGKAIELLDPLTTTDAFNAQYRIHLASALTNAARLHARMAATALARTYYQQSQRLWLELERGGKLTAADRQLSRQVASELAATK